MIVSHKHKFIFFKTAKTAGTSCEVLLSSICGDNDIITPTGEEKGLKKSAKYRLAQNYYIPIQKYTKKDYANLLIYQRRQSFKNHDTAEKVKSYLNPEIWNTYYKFCFERHPVDKTISYYKWCMRTNFFKGSFEDFVLSGTFGKIKGYNIYSISGLPVVDKIFKYEEIDKAFEFLSAKFNLSSPMDISQIKAKSFNDNVEVPENISKKVLDKISLVFARELRLMKYKI